MLMQMLKSMIGLGHSKEGKKIMNSVIKFVEPALVAEWIKDGTAVIVDVREAGERAAGFIPGSTLNALSGFDPKKVPDSTGKHLVFHCQMGRRCGPASEAMASTGFQGEIYRMNGGFSAWVRCGGTVTKK